MTDVNQKTIQEITNDIIGDDNVVVEDTTDDVKETTKKMEELMKKIPNVKSGSQRKITKEERRQELRQRLRDKIRNKRNGRGSKKERDTQLREHVSMLKEKNINIDDYLSSMISDKNQRKLNKKRIMKIINEPDVEEQLNKKNAKKEEEKNKSKTKRRRRRKRNNKKKVVKLDS